MLIDNIFIFCNRNFEIFVQLEVLGTLLRSLVHFLVDNTELSAIEALDSLGLRQSVGLFVRHLLL